MFTLSSQHYDAFYAASGKAYQSEAAAIRQLVDTAVPGARTLLDVACGTGRHLELLSGAYKCTGVDIDAGMLSIARERCPDVDLLEGDMCTLQVGAEFDAVICLFSSIAYAETVDRMNLAVRAMADHVAPGGVLIIEPWIQPEDVDIDHVSHLTVHQPDLRGVRMTSGRVVDGVHRLEMSYLLERSGEVVQFVEHHHMGLFTFEALRSAATACGLAAEVIRPGLSGRGLLLARRPGVAETAE